MSFPILGLPVPSSANAPTSSNLQEQPQEQGCCTGDLVQHQEVLCVTGTAQHWFIMSQIDYIDYGLCRFIPVWTSTSGFSFVTAVLICNGKAWLTLLGTLHILADSPPQCCQQLFQHRSCSCWLQPPPRHSRGARPAGTGTYWWWSSDGRRSPSAPARCPRCQSHLHWLSSGPLRGGERGKWKINTQQHFLVPPTWLKWALSKIDRDSLRPPCLAWPLFLILQTEQNQTSSFCRLKEDSRNAPRDKTPGTSDSAHGTFPGKLSFKYHPCWVQEAVFQTHNFQEKRGLSLEPGPI